MGQDHAPWPWKAKGLQVTKEEQSLYQVLGWVHLVDWGECGTGSFKDISSGPFGGSIYNCLYISSS